MFSVNSEIFCMIVQGAVLEKQHKIKALSPERDSAFCFYSAIVYLAAGLLLLTVCRVISSAYPDLQLPGSEGALQRYW